jgi:hypothetical protein
MRDSPDGYMPDLFLSELVVERALALKEAK